MDATDVANQVNTAERLSSALAIYGQQQGTGTQQQGAPAPAAGEDSGGVIIIKLVIDTSGSMTGTKLTSSKLGICAVVSSLRDDDLVDISTFSDRSTSITSGFHRVGEICGELPNLLECVEADGGTAAFDAVIQALQSLRAFTRSSDSTSTDKTVLILLTDGEDTSSHRTSQDVFLSLQSPGLSRFMFVLVAVQMEAREEGVFTEWVELRHCKQISVSVRTGQRLVAVFKETLMSRILHTAGSNERFYQIGQTAGGDQPQPQPPTLTMGVLRRHDDDYEEGQLSRNVSRANSMVGSDDGLDDDGDLLAGSTPRSPRSPATRHRHYAMEPLLAFPDGLVVDEVANGGAFNYGAGAGGNMRRCSTPPPQTVFRRSQTPPPRARDRTNSVSSEISVEPLSVVIDGVSYPHDCVCPITAQLMTDPVICSDGTTYEKDAITRWLQRSDKSPLTGLPLAHSTLTPNHSLRNVIETLRLTGAASAGGGTGEGEGEGEGEGVAKKSDP